MSGPVRHPILVMPAPSPREISPRRRVLAERERVVRKASVTKHLNDSLKMLRIRGSPEDVLFDVVPRDLCVQWSLVGTGSKSSNTYKERLRETECWADGWVSASGQETEIVCGALEALQESVQFNVPGPGGSASVRADPEVFHVLFVVRVPDLKSVKPFLEAMRAACQVASVQGS